MPRIAGVPSREAGALGRLAYRIARYRYGAVPEPATVLLHHRPAFWAYALWELGNEKAMRRLPASLRELVVYRVATQVGCSWCVDFGTMLQRHHGLDIERLRELDNYQTSPAFTLTERRALSPRASCHAGRSAGSSGCGARCTSAAHSCVTSSRC